MHDSFSYRKPEAIAVVSGNNGRPQPARPTVVIVSADLRAAHARKCLASVKAHTTECDLLVLDNGRSGSFNHAREMNRAIEAARSDLIVFLDDDVVVEPGWIEGLSAALDERTAVVTPLHDNGRGRRSYSGGYLKGDGDGAHAHTLDRPSRVRGTQLACTAAMLVDRRKLPAIRFDEEYRKYFFDAAFTLKVWEAGYRAVCTPRVTVTHLGGATMPQGTTAVSKAAWERDRRIFVRDWVITGRFEALNRLGWQGDAYVKLLSEAPGRIDDLLERHRFDGGTPVVATLTRTWHRYRAFPLCQELLLDRLRSSAGFYASSHGAYRAIMRWAASHGVRESAAARKGARARARRLLRAVQTGSRVAVFGASPFGAECFQVCEAEGVSVDVFLDNHPDRQRSRFLGREVVAPQQFDVWEHRVDAVIVASQAHGAVMRKQLTRPGEVGVPIIDYFER